MNALHQYLLDSARAAHHGEPAPPLPGTHDLATLRAALSHHRETRRLDTHHYEPRRPAAGLRRRLRDWFGRP
ncbi:hypothetical protein TR51_03085 [Kitasatospora griseola]|uniref:Uncharacterized protein n=1 Tax=Kitasatospora griseola TaxID=2064 RepID=A0A0D0Q632_KITGR|nr:hypothetical protein [Kitasatospora griseola]KIQ66558.1 hypothetical protein TR51_03085 [Kitasatospora griseola]